VELAMVKLKSSTTMVLVEVIGLIEEVIVAYPTVQLYIVTAPVLI
jgi:hypothetical protein